MDAEMDAEALKAQDECEEHRDLPAWVADCPACQRDQARSIEWFLQQQNLDETADW